jgi:hypothetical protein
MSKMDDLISKALTEEDRALLAAHGEPGYLSQAFGIFRGPMASVMWLVNITAGMAFLAGGYAVWKMLETSDPLVAIKWGIGSLLLFQVTMLSKTFMGSHMEANRMLRELKRVELQVSLLRAGAGPSG